jgi:hypothetical protein
MSIGVVSGQGDAAGAARVLFDFGFCFFRAGFAKAVRRPLILHLKPLGNRQGLLRVGP